MKFPLSRDEVSKSTYIHRLLIAMIMKHGHAVMLTQAEIDAVDENHSIIVVNEHSKDVTLRYGPKNTEILFFDTPKENESWPNPINPIHPPNSISSSPTLAEPGKQVRQPPYQFEQLPPNPTITGKSDLTPMGLEKGASAAVGVGPLPSAMETMIDQPEMEMEEDQQFYREPETDLPPLSPIEEISEALNGPPLPSHPSRRAVIDDMSMFLKEQQIEAKQTKRRKEKEMILQNRDGLLPFRVKK